MGGGGGGGGRVACRMRYSYDYAAGAAAPVVGGRGSHRKGLCTVPGGGACGIGVHVGLLLYGAVRLGILCRCLSSS